MKYNGDIDILNSKGVDVTLQDHNKFSIWTGIIRWKDSQRCRDIV